jgi:hypothetical protein
MKLSMVRPGFPTVTVNLAAASPSKRTHSRKGIFPDFDEGKGRRATSSRGDRGGGCQKSNDFGSETKVCSSYCVLIRPRDMSGDDGEYLARLADAVVAQSRVNVSSPLSPQRRSEYIQAREYHLLAPALL